MVPVVGAIQGGDEEGPFSSGEPRDRSTLRLLEALKKDASVVAVVVRVDSPGGGVLASDRIYEGVRKLASKKPVVVSMGETAASGGYYVACGAHEIIATMMGLGPTHQGGCHTRSR